MTRRESTAVAEVERFEADLSIKGKS